MSHPNQITIEQSYAAVGVGDVSKVLAMLSDDVSWQVSGQSPLAGTYTGPDEVMGFFTKMGEVYGGTLRLAVRSVLANDEYGVVLTTESAALEGDEVAYTSVHVFRFDAHGRCTQFLALQDDAYNQFWARHSA